MINLIVLIQVTYNLFQPFDYVSSFSLRLVFAIVSMCSILSILIKEMDSERFLSIFVIVTLIIPSCLILYDFMKDFLLYGIVRTELIASPILYIKLILGLILIYFSILFSKTTHENRINDYCLMIVLIGLYVTILSVIIYFESRSYSNSFPKSILSSGLKLLFGGLIILMGFRIKNKKTKIKRGIIYFLILFISYGLM